MKKILLCISILMLSSGAFAQLTPGTWFLGGTLQLSSTNTFNSVPYTVSGNYNTTMFNISPSVGVMLCKYWEVGLELGYSYNSFTYSNLPSSNTTTDEYTMGPFTKYLHLFTENSSFYYQFLGSVNFGFGSQGTVSVDSLTGGNSKATTSTVIIGITPGLAWNPVKHFIFNLYYGSISYSTESVNNGFGNKTTTGIFGFNITPRTLVFGVDYTFPISKSK